MLPKISTPEFETTIPSTQESIKFRPFLVKEEKILYMALEGNDIKEIKNAIQNILENCILTPGIKISKLASFDVEYLFLLLRSKSVGEIIELKIQHDKCGHMNDVMVNINDIKVNKLEGHTNKIDIGGGIGFKFRYPNIDMISEMQNDKNSIEQTIDLICECTEMVYTEDEVYDEFTKEELKQYIEELSKSQFEKIMSFFNTMPKLRHKLEYVCSKCGEKEERIIEGLQSFFT